MHDCKSDPDLLRDPDNPYNCDFDFDHDGGDECTFSGEFEDTVSEEAQSGSVLGNTCYIDGVEQPSCEGAGHMIHTLYDDAPVTKDDEFPDKAPSDSGAQSIHQNDDSSDDSVRTTSQSQTFGMKDGMSTTAVAQNLSVGLGSPIIGTASNWDLRGQTMPAPAATPPPKELPRPAIIPATKGSADSKFNDCLNSAWQGVNRFQNFTAAIARLIGSVTGNNADRAAMTGAIWYKEMTRGFNLNPTGDHGPAQLTSWWKDNHSELIEPGSYDPFTRPAGSPRRSMPFTGDPTANLRTLNNIIGFSLAAYGGSFEKTAFWYGPGPDKTTRQNYANGAMVGYNGLRPFFDCFFGR